MCLTLSLPCSMTALLNTAKRFKLRCLTTKGASRNDLYFTSRLEHLYRSPRLPDPSLFSIVPTLAKFDFFFFPPCTCQGTLETGAFSSLTDCWDVIALTEGDSSCHGCQTARPAADQTAGYGVSADMLNQPLRRNRCQPYMVADSQSSRRLINAPLDSERR